jgi:microcystin-dependent protein
MAETSDPCGCNAVLLQNIDVSTSTESAQLAILRTTTEESFEQTKKGIKSGASIIYGGIPVSGNFSWDDFKKARQARFDGLKYDSSIEKAVGELHQYLSKEVVAAWVTCKENCAKNTEGFSCWIEKYDAQTVTVRFLLNTPPSGVKSMKIKSSTLVGGRAFENGVNDGAAFPKDFKFDDEVPVRRAFFRKPGEPFQILVDTKFHSTAAYLPPYEDDKSVGAIPIGGILAFSGRHDKIPAGWMLCDGQPLLISEAKQLYDVIGTSHGAGYDPASGVKSKDFNLPDYRGRFLRGTDLDAGRDLDRAARTAAVTGANAGAAVGSVQEDAFQDHTHSIALHGNNGLNGIGSFLSPMGNTSTGGADSGKRAPETRPKNVYVNYIIRVR